MSLSKLFRCFCNPRPTITCQTVIYFPFDEEFSKDFSLNPVKTEMYGFHGFANDDGKSCFANATLQCIFNISSFKKVLKSASPSHLKVIFDKYCHPLYERSIDTLSLRLDFAIDLLIDKQQDPSEFLIRLFNNRNYNFLKNLVSFDHFVVHKCSVCKYKKALDITTEVIWNLIMPQNSKKSVLLKELIEHNTQNWNNIYGDQTKTKCPKCKDGDLFEKSVIQNTKDVIIITLQIAHVIPTTKLIEFGKLKDVRVSNIAETALSVDGHIYYLLAAIFHNGESLDCGHYYAIVRKGEYFYKISDDSVQMCSWPSNGDEVYMLFYGKQ